MARDSFFLIGGCTGGYPAFHEPMRPRFAFENDNELKQTGALATESFPRLSTGGRTTSFLLRYQETFVIIDHGAGVENIAQVLQSIFADEEIKNPVVHCLQTHYHEDHISGLRVNRLLGEPNVHLKFHLPHFSSVEYHKAITGETDAVVEDYLRFSFQQPFWPIDYNTLTENGATRSHIAFQPGDTLQIDDLTINTCCLNHPGGSTGFRIETPTGKSIVIATDYEPDDNIEEMAAFVSGADLLLLDVQYTNAEYAGDAPIQGVCLPREGWGHGCPRLSAPILAASEKRPRAVRLTHHEPQHNDLQLAGLVSEFAAELSTLGLNPFDLDLAKDGHWRHL